MLPNNFHGEIYLENACLVGSIYHQLDPCWFLSTILESILLHVCKYGKKLIPTRWMGAEIILHFDTRFIFGFLLSFSFLYLQTFPVKMQIISILGSADYPVSVSTIQLYHLGFWRQLQMIHKQRARLCPSKHHVQNQVVGGIRPLSCVCWPRSTCITASVMQQQRLGMVGLPRLEQKWSPGEEDEGRADLSFPCPTCFSPTAGSSAWVL